jgi:hypothetical protein
MEASGQLHAVGALPTGKVSGTHWIEGWVSPGYGFGRGGKEKKTTSLPLH